MDILNRILDVIIIIFIAGEIIAFVLLFLMGLIKAVVGIRYLFTGYNALEDYEPDVPYGIYITYFGVSLYVLAMVLRYRLGFY